MAAVRANVTARPSTGSPRVTPARCQSAIADRFEITSPMPERRMAGSERRTKSRSTTSAIGIWTP